MLIQEIPDATKSLVALIEKMMINESRRYVELRLLRESLPYDRRGPTSEALAQVRTTMERLSHFRSTLLCRPYMGIDLPTITRARGAVSRDVLKLM